MPATLLKEHPLTRASAMPGLVSIASVFVPVAVPPQSIVLAHLMPRERGACRDVGPQVDEPQTGADLGDRLHPSDEIVMVDVAGREERPEVTLGVDQPLSELDRLVPHPDTDRVDPAALRPTQIEGVGQLEHVPGSGMAVELGRSRETHPGTGPQILDLGRGKRRDLAGPRVGAGRRLDLGRGRRGNRQQRDGREETPAVHRTSSWEYGVDRKRVLPTSPPSGTFVT